MRQRTEDATEVFRNTPGAAQRVRLSLDRINPLAAVTKDVTYDTTAMR